MKPNIKKGDKYLCIKDYVMDDDSIAYIEGKTYIADKDNNLPSEELKIHEMNDEEYFDEYFTQVSGSISTDVVSSSNTALRYNEGKPEYSLIDLPSLEGCAQVLAFGAKKYSRNNWKKGFPISSILNSMLRHIAALQDGEEIDPESGLPHIGHIQCNALFLGCKNNTNDLKDG